MGDDYDYQRDKDDEMLADYYDDLVTEERQAYCEHSNSYVQGIRILIPEDSEVMKRPLLRQHDKQYYEIEIEACTAALVHASLCAQSSQESPRRKAKSQ